MALSVIGAMRNRASAGANLLAEGYLFAGDWFSTDTTAYLCFKPGSGTVYHIIFDTARAAFACDCGDNQYRGLPCKHLVCLSLNKASIDAEIEAEREWCRLTANAEPTVKTVTVGGYLRTRKATGRFHFVTGYTRRVRSN
jgi:hypothetical protein